MENSFFRWFNHDLQRVREQILLAGDGRSNISASLRRIFAAGMRRGRRVLITIFAYSCFTRNRNYCSRDEIWSLCAANLRGFCESIHGFHQPRLHVMSFRNLWFLASRENSKILRRWNLKFSIFCESYRNNIQNFKVKRQKGERKTERVIEYSSGILWNNRFDLSVAL